jgi:hypothetical protein
MGRNTRQLQSFFSISAIDLKKSAARRCDAGSTRMATAPASASLSIYGYALVAGWAPSSATAALGGPRR